MEQEIMTGNQSVIVGTGKLYSGGKNTDDNEKTARKALGLPTTKQLVYYKDKKDASSAVDVISYRPLEFFDVTNNWSVIEVTLKDQSTVKIHSDYFAEMQKPNFIADMEKQALGSTDEKNRKEEF